MASCHLVSQNSSWVISFTNNTAFRRALGYRRASGHDSIDLRLGGFEDGLQTGWRGCGECPGGAWTAEGCGLGRC